MSYFFFLRVWSRIDWVPFEEFIITFLSDFSLLAEGWTLHSIIKTKGQQNVETEFWKFDRFSTEVLSGIRQSFLRSENLDFVLIETVNFFSL